jgi:hypothetical protein
MPAGKLPGGAQRIRRQLQHALCDGRPSGFVVNHAKGAVLEQIDPVCHTRQRNALGTVGSLQLELPIETILEQPFEDVGFGLSFDAEHNLSQTFGRGRAKQTIPFENGLTL